MYGPIVSRVGSRHQLSHRTCNQSEECRTRPLGTPGGLLPVYIGFKKTPVNQAVQISKYLDSIRFKIFGLSNSISGNTINWLSNLKTCCNTLRGGKYVIT